jgi:hypothetical protein
MIKNILEKFFIISFLLVVLLICACINGNCDSYSIILKRMIFVVIGFAWLAGVFWAILRNAW